MTYRNPLVESGEYERVFVAEVEVGDLIGQYGDLAITDVTPYPGERVLLTIGGLDRVSLRRDTTLLVKQKCERCRRFFSDENPPHTPGVCVSCAEPTE